MSVGPSRGGISLPEKIAEIDRALAAASIPHAVGGAIALAYYGEPRATIDVDVNVFVHVGAWPRVRDALAPLGIDVEVDEQMLERDGRVRLWWDLNPVDLFFSYDPFHEDMERATRRVPFLDGRLPILGPEHLLICKAILDRPKDWLDIEAMLVVTDPLDLGEIESWLARLVGADDKRLAKLGEILERLEIEHR
jgi:hypothetical protein